MVILRPKFIVQTELLTWHRESFFNNCWKQRVPPTSLLWLDTFAYVFDYWYLLLFVLRVRLKQMSFPCPHSHKSAEMPQSFIASESRRIALIQKGGWKCSFCMTAKIINHFSCDFECMRIQFSGSSLYKGLTNAVHNLLVTQYTVNQ